VNGIVCVDASVAAKWVLEEPDRDRALALLIDARTIGTRIVGPPQFRAEVTSALTQRIFAGELPLPDAIAALNTFLATEVDVVLDDALYGQALRLASEFNWAYPYDAFYLAVGELLDCDVWTADGRFHRAAAQRYPRLRLLTDYALAR
jgi:predicted nucleic acid-binding protein